jgi:hypothetical protein
MQIQVAIPENVISFNISMTTHSVKEVKVSFPMLRGVNNLELLTKTCFSIVALIGV